MKQLSYNFILLILSLIAFLALGRLPSSSIFHHAMVSKFADNHESSLSKALRLRGGMQVNRREKNMLSLSINYIWPFS
jgi:hypothetical protein